MMIVVQYINWLAVIAVTAAAVRTSAVIFYCHQLSAFMMIGIMDGERWSV